MKRPTILRCLLIVAAASVCVTYGAIAGTRPMRFDHISLQDGLSQSTVMSILQDSQGFMWFATESGLNRYDGFSIKRYNRDRNGLIGLRSDFIWAMAEDSRGDLWLATEGGGVARWDRRTDTFQSFVHEDGNTGSLASDLTRTLFIDAEGRVWIGTRDSGLDLLDPETGAVTHFRNDPNDIHSLSNDSVYVIYADRSGQIWVGTDGGLNRFVPETRDFVRYVHNAKDPKSLSDNSVLSIFEDREGVFWIGTFKGGLNRFDRASGRFARYRHNSGDPASLSHDHVRLVFGDRDNRLWVGTENGLDLLDRTRGRFAHYRHDRADPEGLSDSYVMSMYEDLSGMLWIGTRAAGVNKWNPRSWSFGHFRGGWLDGANVTAFADDGGGRLWVGTVGPGLIALDEDFEQVRRYSQDDGRLSDDRVMSLLLDRDGMLWVGTMVGGLNRLDPDTGESRVFRHDPDDPASLGADGIMALYENRAGAIWIGTFGGGAAVFDRKTGTLRRFAHDPDDPTTLSDSRASAITEDSNGATWIGTDGGGLNLLEVTTGTFRHFRHDRTDPASLSSDKIYALHIDTRGNLWIGTAGGGLDRVIGSSRDPGGIRFENFSQLDGLSSNVIYGIQSDFDGNLWLSSNNGLTRFNPATGDVKTFHRSHGLQGEEFNFGAHHQGMDGKLYFGGVGGFNAFFPSQLIESTFAPPVVLTSFEKLNRPVETDEPYALLKNIELGHQDDVITFEFAALDFSAPDENRYAYRLDGFDSDWIGFGNRRRVTYTNLAAGNYVFRVRAANSDGVWNDNGLSLPVRVVPAPWETMWAYAFYAAAILFLLAAFWQMYRRRMGRAVTYHRKLEALVLDRTGELEGRNRELQELSRAKSEFLARMSHQIRTPMNSILGTIEMLLSTDLDERQHRFATTVNSSIDALLKIVNDIQDLSKIEAGQLQLETGEFDPAALVEASVELFRKPAAKKGLEIICMTSPDCDPKVFGDPLRLRQVLANLIGNAVKFTETGKIIVQLTVASENGDEAELRFKVIDTGIGISTESQALIFEPFSRDDGSAARYNGTGLGLKVSKQLVGLMGGALHVDSAPGEGSTIWFTARVGKIVAAAKVDTASPGLEDSRILIVNGDDAVTKLLESRLAARRVRSAVAETDGEALTKLRTAAMGDAPYDLVILDMCMPQSDGLELARMIRADARLTRLKTLLITATRPDLSTEQLEELGVDACLSGAVTEARLYDTLIAMMGRTATDVDDERAVGLDSPVPIRPVTGRS